MGIYCHTLYNDIFIGWFALEDANINGIVFASVNKLQQKYYLFDKTSWEGTYYEKVFALNEYFRINASYDYDSTATDVDDDDLGDFSIEEEEEDEEDKFHGVLLVRYPTFGSDKWFYVGRHFRLDMSGLDITPVAPIRKDVNQLDDIYDLQGRKMPQGNQKKYKGIYIVGGKKVYK